MVEDKRTQVLTLSIWRVLVTITTFVLAALLELTLRW